MLDINYKIIKFSILLFLKILLIHFNLQNQKYFLLCYKLRYKSLLIENKYLKSKILKLLVFLNLPIFIQILEFKLIHLLKKKKFIILFIQQQHQNSKIHFKILFTQFFYFHTKNQSICLTKVSKILKMDAYQILFKYLILLIIYLSSLL